jgi:hypothetical protein
MAERVQAENDLVAIKVSLDSEHDSSLLTTIRFDVARQAERLHRTSVHASELGLPTEFRPGEFRYREPRWRLPPSLLTELRAEVDSALGGDNQPVLWLHLASPSGFLPLVPWERLLAPAFERPVVRVPNLTLVQPRDASEVDIAICASQPVAKRAFDAPRSVSVVAQHLLNAIPGKGTVHLFVDAATHRALSRSGIARDDATGSIRLYDPAEAPPFHPEAGRALDGGAISWNPWVHWIAHATRNTTLDAVHFIGHAYMSQDQASLAVAESPVLNRDMDSARFIGPRQIAAFLDLVGAWYVGFSSPDPAFSPMGMRLLIDDLAHRRAGPILLHDLATDPLATRLGETWSALVGPRWPDGASDVALYCHPRIFAPEMEPLGSYASTLLANPRIGGLEDVPEQPAWVKLTRRYLEQSTARLFPEVAEPTSAGELAAAEGVRQALSFVSNVVSSLESRESPLEPMPSASVDQGPEKLA